MRRSGYEIRKTFQRFIDHVTRGLDFVFVYLDDLLVTSPDHKTHKKLNETFENSIQTVNRIWDNNRTG